MGRSPRAEPEPEGTYADIAREWGVGESAVRVALHWLRGPFAAILREEIGRTVESLAEIDDEIRYLLDVLGPEAPRDRASARARLAPRG